MNALKNLSLILLLSLAFTGCHNKSSKLNDFNLLLYAPEYASGFDIKGAGGKESVLITVRNPWQGADSVTTWLFIVRNGEEVPEGFAGQVLKGDAKRIVAMSSTHIAMLDAIGEVRCITGVSGIDYISNPDIQARRDSIGDVGYEGNINYELLLSLDPDRLALYHYAHLPHIFKPQRRIDTAAVPGSEEKLDILQYAVQTLTERDYVFIGMDHFAKPKDELSVALREGWLQRNFQGYSTYADCDLVAIGVSSIGKIGSTYVQNERDIDAYYAAIDAGHLPVMRGYQLNRDDLLRRNIIQDLMCRFSLDYQLYESTFGIPFAQYFSEELADLNKLADLGLVRLKPNGLKVTPKGRFVIRNIAMVFDYHLRHKETAAKYSQTV